MYTYSMTQWLAFFFIYCFFGWCFESVYVSVHEHRWVNRGFMTGPYIPLYGSGAVLMLFLTIPVRGNYLLMYIVGAIGAKSLILLAGAFGFATLWAAVFADVGVALIAVLNSMRILKMKFQ